MQIPNCEFGVFNGVKEVFVDLMQPGMLIRKSASTVIPIQLVDRGVSEERAAFIFTAHPETGDYPFYDFCAND
jgi:hypothetical protein